MKIKRTALFAALLATVIGTQAEVTLQPDNNGATNQFIYAFTNVVEGISSVTGAPSNVSGSFTAGSGGFSVTVTAKEGWSESAAQGAVNTSQFNAYFTGLGNTNVISADSDDWGVFSSGESSSSSDSRRLNGGEVLIFTFDTTELDGELRLNNTSFEISPDGKKRDALLCTSSNTVIDAAWNVFGQDGGSLPSFPYAINNGDKLIIAQVNSVVRMSSIKLDVFPAPGGGLLAPNVSASAGYRSVELSWLDDPNTNLFDSFTVERSVGDTNSFVVIASNLTESTYTDFDLPIGVTNYYTVSAIDTNGSATAGANIAFAVPFIPVPTGLASVPYENNGLVDLDWDDTTNGWFGSYNVYRKTLGAADYGIVVSNLTQSAFADTNVVNDVAYLYAVSVVDTNADESALSAAVYGEATADLVIVNLDGSQQKEIRTTPDATGTNWLGFGTSSPNGRRRIGGYLFGSLARYVMKFPLQESDLGGKTVDDIAKVVLRVHMTRNDLRAAGYASEVEVYSSQTTPANTAVATNDFEDTSYSLVGYINDLTNGTPEDQWYEIDVTTAVLADLANDGATNSSGSAFRLQLNDDLGIPVGDAPCIEIGIFSDEGLAARLKIKFKGGYSEWTSKWLPADVSDETGDYDGDGLSNLGEYAINGNPTNAADKGQTSLSQDGSVFTYIYASNTVDSSLSYRLIDSENLVFGPFGTNNNTVAGVGPTVDDYASVTNTYGITNDTLFINLKVEK